MGQWSPRIIGGGVEEQVSRGQSVNENGVVAGWFDPVDATETLFTWDGVAHEHGVLPGSSPKVAAINNNLQIVGHEEGSLLGGWLWENNVFYPLPDLAGGDDSTARDINELGIVAGTSWVNQTDMHAVKWVDKNVVPLEEPAGVVQSRAFSINDSGSIIGGVVLATTFEVQASVWINDEFHFLGDQVINLGDWHLQTGIAIDENGRILVHGFSETSPMRRVVLIPVPEPATIALVDIKPGSFPNSVNLKSKGVLPVAILGTADFDVNDVDIASLLFGNPWLIDNGGTAVSPWRSAYEDVSGDGRLDLTLKFSTADLVEYGALGPDTLEGLLTGALFDGTLFEGMDSIRIVPPKGSKGNNLQISAVPEPSTLALTAFGLLGIGWRRRKRAKRA